MTKHSFLAACAVAVAMLDGTAEAANKPEPLALRAPAFISSAGGGDVVIRMRVEPDARSRELTIEWVAEDLSGGSHAITLDGARAAATHQFSIKRMSPGEHVVTAILRLSDGTEVRRAATVVVVGVGGLETTARGAAQGGAASGHRRPEDRR